MNRTFLKCLSAAACLAAASSGVAAQSAATEVHVVRGQDPRNHPPVEQRLVEVIEMLGSDEMTEAQQKKARLVLQEVVERLHHDQKAGVAASRRMQAPESAAADVEVFEVEGGDVESAGTPGVAVRTRVLRLRDDDGGVAGAAPEVARVIRGREPRFAPRAPKAPRAPEPPRPAEAPKEVRLHFFPEPDGQGVEWREVRERGAAAHAEALRAAEQHLARGEAKQAEGRLRLLVEKQREGAAKRRAVAILRQAEAADDDDADEHEHEPDDARTEANEGRDLRLLLQRKRAAADERRALGRAEAGRGQRMRVQSDDVTETRDEGDLRAMLDEMRAEMREVRALMQQIRERAPARNEPAPDAPLRPMRQ